MELEAALDAALPGAGEALVQATATVDEATGALHLRIPSLHPVLPPVYDVIRAEVASVLWRAFGNPVMHRVTFGSGVSRGRATTPLTVYRPGDPAVPLWPKLSSAFGEEVLVSDNPMVARLLGGVVVAAFSVDNVWLDFQTTDVRRRLGQVPGAASGLNDRLNAWNGGVTAFCYASRG